MHVLQKHLATRNSKQNDNLMHVRSEKKSSEKGVMRQKDRNSVVIYQRNGMSS